MKNPTVVYVVEDLDEIKAADRTIRTKADVERALRKAVGLAEKMSLKALRHLTRVLDQPTTRTKKLAWNGDRHVKRYFGKAPGRDRMHNMCDRIDRVYKRLRDKTLRIRLKPQKGKSWNGHNSGGPLSPRQFVLYPKWFRADEEQRAAIVIHELLHDWHVDHKVKNPRTGKRETVYSDALARELARQRPGSARRNPENVERFCKALWP